MIIRNGAAWIGMALAPCIASGGKAKAPQICAMGEEVTAFFAGEVNVGGGGESCNPTMSECWFLARIDAGPDAAGVYTLSWADGDPDARKVHASHTKRVSSGEACGLPKVYAGKGPAEDQEGSAWNAPEIPCTTLLRLHWEGSDIKWNGEAIKELKAELLPDEVIDGFDWHLVMRFHDVDRCERAYETVARVVGQCDDKLNCR
eukprot:gnl/TRDRNA2_/TRDRNA2_167130_c0_seq1.p1 gnl/TRDRNA2_/TRDRNA2_167130_c0~~gnl/TRDRNA2_/TRDRNA2_167130_c0_seq1.p1  ORF type:complete len:203 (-),score=30.21 gnl/TRDRNA2_/TRDRNA2_167130_c0_seq1:6-614(-)